MHPIVHIFSEVLVAIGEIVGPAAPAFIIAKLSDIPGTITVNRHAFAVSHIVFPLAVIGGSVFKLRKTIAGFNVAFEVALILTVKAGLILICCPIRVGHRLSHDAKRVNNKKYGQSGGTARFHKELILGSVYVILAEQVSETDFRRGR